jgi:hypothetical protein
MGKPLIVKEGDKYNRLTIIREIEPTISSYNKIRRRFECICDCGNIWKGFLFVLRNGTTKSCGCFKTETTTTHGKKYTVEYRTWLGMKQRCYYEKTINFKDYGGRGIKVCDRWLNSFVNFYQDMGDRPKGTSIDRINNDGNYEPSNCRWATRREQNRNKRNVKSNKH